MDPKHFSLYGNTITPDQDRKALAWQKMFVDKFAYDPNETYELSVHDNAQLGDALGIRDLRRDTEGDPIDAENGIVISTIRMGYGHYRIAMAGASAARAMGRTPYWLDLLAIPGITQDAINWWNTNYSKYSRVSQRNELFDKYVWESVTSGDKTLPGLNWLLNNQAMGWPWRFLKANARDYRKSELFANLHHALPPGHADPHGPHVELHGGRRRGHDQCRGHDVRQLADGLPAHRGRNPRRAVAVGLLRVPDHEPVRRGRQDPRTPHPPTRSSTWVITWITSWSRTSRSTAPRAWPACATASHAGSS